MRSTLLTSLAFLLVLAPDVASAQTTPAAPAAAAAPTEPLSLMDTLQRAVANNLQLRKDRVAIDIEDAQMYAARGQFDFTLTGTLSFQRSTQPPLTAQDIVSGYTNDFGFDVGLQRNLETGGQLKLTMQNDAINTNSRLSCGSPTGVATTCTYYNSQLDLVFTHPLLRGLGVEITEANIRRNKIQKDLALLNRQMDAANTLRDVIIAYWELAYATQALAISNSAVDLAREQLRITKAQIDVGRLAPIDQAAVERAIGDRLQDVALAEQTLYGRSLDLRRLLGNPVDPSLASLSALDVPSATPHEVEVGTELRHALDMNPQLRSLKMGLQLNQIDLDVANNTLLPQLNFVGDVGSRGKNPNFAQTLAQTAGLDSLTLSAALNYSAPLENRAANGNYRAAKLAIDSAHIDAATFEMGIRDSVVRTALQVKTASVRVDLARQTVGFAQQNLEAEKARFSVGRSTNNDVLLRQQELKSAQISVIRANVDLLESDVTLAAITADLLTQYNVVLKGLK